MINEKSQNTCINSKVHEYFKVKLSTKSIIIFITIIFIIVIIIIIMIINNKYDIHHPYTNR